MTDRRAHFRMLDSELVIVHWREGSQDLEQLGNVDDVSLGGMRVRVDFPIPVGAAVEISYESLFRGMLTGIVKYHLERHEGIFIGIEFTGESPESMLLLYPELFSVAQ